VEKTDTDLAQTYPTLAGPLPPESPLPFFKYVRTVRDNSIAGLHKDVFKQWIVEIKLWRLHTFIINDPAGIKHVLVDNADNYIKGDMEQRISGAWSDEGFTGAEGEPWRQRRRTMSSSFDYRSILGNSSIILNAAESLIARWGALPSGAVIEASAEMTQLTLDIISRIVFSSDSAEFAGIIARATALRQSEKMFDLLDFAPGLDRHWASHKLQKKIRIFKEMDGAIDRLIQKRSGESAQSNDLLGRLMAEKDTETGSGLSTREIHSQIITVIGAGHETVALALSWTWYLLAQHPLQEARLHAELGAVLGGRTPTLDDLAKLPYTRMVIEESLRLYPPFPVMAWRGALAEDEVSGVKIHKGATVTIVPWVLHRHAGLWDNPERFDPERFSPDRSAGRSRFAYLPFGTGPRVCIGASFAMTQMMLILAALAQRYKLRLIPGHPVELKGPISLRPRHGLKMTLQSRHSGL
jgi:cytochrome P450